MKEKEMFYAPTKSELIELGNLEKVIVTDVLYEKIKEGQKEKETRLSRFFIVETDALYSGLKKYFGEPNLNFIDEECWEYCIKYKNSLFLIRRKLGDIFFGWLENQDYKRPGSKEIDCFLFFIQNILQEEFY